MGKENTVEKTLNNNLKGVDNEECLVLRLKSNSIFIFLIGLFMGSYVLRYELLKETVNAADTAIRGYEYDSENDCVWVRSKVYNDDYCRPRIRCDMCANVTSIDVVEDMSQELFEDKYAYTGRPVLVKKATVGWKAMDVFDFEFFRDLYESINSPVLYNNEEGCQFFAWEFAEFSDLQEVFDMPKYRYEMKGLYDPWYIGWANCDEVAQETLRDFYDRPSFLSEDSESGKKDWFFIGTPGFGAPFHIDNVKYPSWQAQIRGRKRWSLRPPPECKRTCHGEMSVVLEPGDIIVVNTNWWDHATSVIEDLSITVTNEYK